jgi:Sulfatase-modifying factor enzyme 1
MESPEKERPVMVWIPSSEFLKGSDHHFPQEESAHYVAVDLSNPCNWRGYVPDTDWRHPEGSQSSMEGRRGRPVVRVTYEDASALARWAGKELPNRSTVRVRGEGGLDGAPFCWVSALTCPRLWLPVEGRRFSWSRGESLVHLPFFKDGAIPGRIVGAIATDGAIFLQGRDEGRRARHSGRRGPGMERYTEPSYEQQKPCQSSDAHHGDFSKQCGY